ncbi:MAG: dephospho-CoA kinase [Prevotella sp.]|nr:dephospho-CoA kinase [Prevotella sp.]
MQHIAITGGIGSGKSYVCRLLEQRGISVYDCDAAAKRLMRTSPTLHRQLTELIGPEAYESHEANKPHESYEPHKPHEFILNKAAVARFLLASAENAQAIDDIVHPAVAADFLQSGKEWLESAILFQSGFDRRVHFDAIVCVTAPEDVRIRRIMLRDDISRERAAQWLAGQWPQEEVLSRSDYEIVNDGQQPLHPQIEKILQIINNQ